jgi:nicotinate-nucleotide adenylyltransferase
VRVLIFGGSFDPPHVGHAALLTAAADRVRPDRILVIPTFQAPLKQGPAAPAQDRLRMLRLGLLPSLPRRWRRRARIDERELRGRRRVYTVQTLAALRAEHPDWELHFALGSDGASAWRRWRRHEELPALCRWWTALRPGTQARRIPAHFTVIPRPMPDVSSTELRADLAAGLDCSRWLHPRVADFIARRGLYGTGLISELAAGLKPGRLVHTLAVRRLAEALALRWDECPRRASLAALLHDCGRRIKKRRLARYARDHRLRVPLLAEIARRQPGLLHAYVGEDLARRRFGCRDRAVLRAVRNHTLGAASMSRLDIVLYVADAVSEDRTHPQAAPLRRLAFQDLHAAFSASLGAKLGHAVERGAWLHPLSVSLWNRLCAKP